MQGRQQDTIVHIGRGQGTDSVAMVGQGRCRLRPEAVLHRAEM